MGVVDAVARELMLFAAVMLLIGGIDDLLVDMVYWIRRVRHGPVSAFRLQPPADAGRIAVFVAAWQEAEVIGAMLRTALDRFGAGDYRIYVGCYPNDPATVDAVAAVAESDARVRLVIGGRAGPTTKADNLNLLWRALCRDDMADGVRSRAVVLHDAEDVVHPEELGVFAALIGVADVVQIPVLPLIHPKSRMVSGHYADEFAQAN
ncbi:adsorption protein B [Sphingomonas gellani]|uniref:Adsorption protein B n=2 Tax=Sphingomonas gellani TaxID=1166340 RepID=A0A1H8H5P1_9SPHN|nr:adsorption protein B [Sphingomonas gellani]